MKTTLRSAVVALRPALRASARWAGAGFALILVVVLFSAEGVTDRILGLDPFWMVAALIPAACMVLLTSLFQGRFLAALGLPLRPREWLAQTVVFGAGNVLLPLKGGSIARAVYLSRTYGFEYSSFGAINAAAQVLNVVAFAVLGLGAALVLDRASAAAFHAAAAAGGLVFILSTGRLRAEGPIGRLLMGWSMLVARKRLLVEGALILAGNIVLDLMLFWIAFAALGIETSWSALLLINATANVAGMLVFFSSGLGVKELAAGVAGGALGVSPETGILAAALVRIALALVLVVLLPWAWRVISDRSRETRSAGKADPVAPAALRRAS